MNQPNNTNDTNKNCSFKNRENLNTCYLKSVHLFDMLLLLYAQMVGQEVAVHQLYSVKMGFQIA